MNKEIIFVKKHKREIKILVNQWLETLDEDNQYWPECCQSQKNMAEHFTMNYANDGDFCFAQWLDRMANE